VNINRIHHTQFRRYSAATMAAAYALKERLMVEMTVAPFGTANAARDLQNSEGSATCSITCNQVKCYVHAPSNNKQFP